MKSSSWILQIIFFGKRAVTWNVTFMSVWAPLEGKMAILLSAALIFDSLQDLQHREPLEFYPFDSIKKMGAGRIHHL